MKEHSKPSKEETKKDNELIANQDLIDDFMGREHWRVHLSHEWISYHNDWNRLMPVCVKLQMEYVSTDINTTYNEVINRIMDTSKDERNNQKK